MRTYLHTYIHAYIPTLHCVALRCFALRCFTLHYITLHFIIAPLHTHKHAFIHTYTHYITYIHTYCMRATHTRQPAASCRGSGPPPPTCGWESPAALPACSSFLEFISGYILVHIDIMPVLWIAGLASMSLGTVNDPVLLHTCELCPECCI